MYSPTHSWWVLDGGEYQLRSGINNAGSAVARKLDGFQRRCGHIWKGKLLSYFGNRITIAQMNRLLLSHYTNWAIQEQSNRNLYSPSSMIYKSVARKLNFTKYLAFHWLMSGTHSYERPSFLCDWTASRCASQLHRAESRGEPFTYCLNLGFCGKGI